MNPALGNMVFFFCFSNKSGRNLFGFTEKEKASCGEFDSLLFFGRFPIPTICVRNHGILNIGYTGANDTAWQEKLP